MVLVTLKSNFDSFLNSEKCKKCCLTLACSVFKRRHLFGKIFCVVVTFVSKNSSRKVVQKQGVATSKTVSE